VPEAVEVRLLGGSVGFAAALHKRASTRSQQKRVRKPIDRYLLNMGDQDWIDRVLRDEKPSTSTWWDDGTAHTARLGWRNTKGLGV
jgi:hypothetical protein